LADECFVNAALSESTIDFSQRASFPDVHACLDNILRSVAFRRSHRLAKFLRFLVDQALNGRIDPVKEYVIGVEVFDRVGAYDPRLDPIVRVEARRLRAKLRQYYQHEGANDPILIEMPARGYVPAFRHREPGEFAAPVTNSANLTPASLVILPLVSLKSHAGLRSFAEGLTDEISCALANVPNVRIVARTSAFHFRDRPGDVRDIGAELDADYVFEGSVRKEKNRVRVLVQIASSNSGFLVWSGSYDQQVESMLTAQTEIAGRISADLAAKMTSVQSREAEPRRQNARTVLALYHKGRRYLTSRTNDGIRRSIECFQQVIERDATCALAYAGLADSYSLGARYEVLPPQESWRKARAAALDAVRIDCSLAEAHAALGFIELHYVRNTLSAEREFSAAIQLNPRYAPARQWYAWCLIASGRAEAGIDNIRAALELDPLSANARADLALALYFSRRYQDSVAESSKTLQFAPGFYRSHQLLGLNFLQTGDYARAVDQFQVAIASSGRNSRMLVLLAHAYARMGKADETQLLANELTQSHSSYVPAIDFALLHSALENYDRTFEYLEQAFCQDEGELIWVPVDPIHDRIRNDSRFRPFVDRIGITSNGTRSPGQLSPAQVSTRVTQ